MSKRELFGEILYEISDLLPHNATISLIETDNEYEQLFKVNSIPYYIFSLSYDDSTKSYSYSILIDDNLLIYTRTIQHNIDKYEFAMYIRQRFIRPKHYLYKDLKFRCVLNNKQLRRYVNALYKRK